jgi:hypothetical protein
MWQVAVRLYVRHRAVRVEDLQRSFWLWINFWEIL